MRIIAKLLRKKQVPEPVYATRVKEGPHADGSWTAELSKDGIPYADIRVGVISALIAQTK